MNLNPLKPLSRIVGMSNVFFGGFHKAYRIDTFKEPKRDVLPRYINVFSRKLAKVFDIDVVAVNEIPQHHALWVSNHVSWLDIPVVGSVCPAFFIAKSEVKDMPVIGPLATAAGTMFIKRGSGDAGSVSEQLATFLDQEYPVIFFPEGTTSDGKQVKKVHGKLLQASIDSGVPVQPIVLCYVNKNGNLCQRMPFIGEISFPAHLAKMLTNKPTKAYLMALDTIDPTGQDMESLRTELQEKMEAGLQQLHAQVVGK